MGSHRGNHKNLQRNPSRLSGKLIREHSLASPNSNESAGYTQYLHNVSPTKDSIGGGGGVLTRGPPPFERIMVFSEFINKVHVSTSSHIRTSTLIL